MKYKTSQLIMIWFLPLIVIGGLFYPLLGYIMVGFMAFFLVFAYFNKRYWCWYLCPRGAFLDIVLNKISLRKPVPKFFTQPWFRWSIFWLFMTILVLRLIHSGGDLLIIGGIFVSICIITTILSIILGIPLKSRAWCTFCPMGTLQDKVSSLKKKAH